MEKTGFIILRHVNSYMTDKIWKKCYDHIRMFHPETPIMIIDDNSDKTFLSKHELYKTFIIESEFNKKGEILPYYYYLKYNFCENAMIINDTVFINRFMDLTNDDYKILWSFKQSGNEVEKTLLMNLNNSEQLLDFYNGSEWKGCFGGMCIINYNFLSNLNEKYNIVNLLNFINNKKDRVAFETIIGCVLNYERRNEMSFFGDIDNHCEWGIKYEVLDLYSFLPANKAFVIR